MGSMVQESEQQAYFMQENFCVLSFEEKKSFEYLESWQLTGNKYRPNTFSEEAWDLDVKISAFSEEIKESLQVLISFPFTQGPVAVVSSKRSLPVLFFHLYSAFNPREQKENQQYWCAITNTVMYTIDI